MKARRLKLFKPGFKMENRECNWAHYPINLWDRIVIWFSDYYWVRSPSGKPFPSVKTKRWTYSFREKESDDG